MAYIYAIIKEENSNILSKVTRYIDAPQGVSEFELCDYHDYAFSPAEQYCSYLPRINASKLAYTKKYRLEAVALERATKKIRAEYGDRLVAVSHSNGGWTGINWIFNDDIKFQIGTNFGYGSVSYFYVLFYYRDLILAPYSFYIKYGRSNYASVIRCTYEYAVNYNSWDKVVTDTLEFYNAIVSGNESYVFSWLDHQLSEMVSGLEKFIYSTSAYFADCSINNSHISGYAITTGDDFWIIKSEKIAFSLDFIDNISKLPSQVKPENYIKRIELLCEKFSPLLKEKIDATKNILANQEGKLAQLLQDRDYILYDKMYSKYYWNRQWYMTSNKINMLRFLISLKNRYGIARDEIRNRISDLKQLLDKKKQIEADISKTKFLCNALAKDDERITSFFQKD